MEFLFAVIALTVFTCWLVDNRAAVGLFRDLDRLPPILKIVALLVGMYFIAKGAGII